MLPRWSVIGLFLLVGCKHGSAKLAGHWRGVHAEGVASAVDDTANAYAGKMQLDVTGDTLTLTTPAGAKTDHYKLVREDKSSAVITTDGDGPAEPQTFAFVDDKTMRWMVVPGKAVVFNKE